MQGLGWQAELFAQGTQFLLQFLTQLCLEITEATERGTLRDNTDVNVIHGFLHINNMQICTGTRNLLGLFSTSLDSLLRSTATRIF
jgi:hypothetical protein